LRTVSAALRSRVGRVGSPAGDRRRRARLRRRRAAAERVDEHDEPRPVAHQHLEPDLVDELADAGEHVAGATAARPPPRPRRSAPRRAASSIASQISAIASGRVQRSPAAGAAAPARRR
jgi:hypothetical protein